MLDRTVQNVTLVAFADPAGPLLDEVQFCPDIAAQVSSLRHVLNQLSENPLAFVQPEWEAQPWGASSQTLAHAWRKVFSDARIVILDQSWTPKGLERHNFGRTYFGEAVIFARRRKGRREAERSYLSQMAKDLINIRSYDHLLETVLKVDER